MDEFYDMTWGNFQRRVLGYVRSKWTATRDIVAAIYDVNTKKNHKVRGEDVFPFGITTKRPDPPTEAEREVMRKRHEHRLKHEQGKRSNSKN